MMATKVPVWLERVLLPQVNELKGGIKELDAKADGEFKVMHSEIRRLDEKIDLSNMRLEGRIDALDKRMDVTQRAAVVEEKMRELEANHRVPAVSKRSAESERLSHFGLEPIICPDSRLTRNGSTRQAKPEGHDLSCQCLMFSSPSRGSRVRESRRTRNTSSLLFPVARARLSMRSPAPTISVPWLLATSRYSG